MAAEDPVLLPMQPIVLNPHLLAVQGEHEGKQSAEGEIPFMLCLPPSILPADVAGGLDREHRRARLERRLARRPVGGRVLVEESEQLRSGELEAQLLPTTAWRRRCAQRRMGAAAAALRRGLLLEKRRLVPQ